MGKTMIVYASRHHGNTQKLVRHLAKNYDVALINADEVSCVDYGGYDVIGFASGLDFGKFYPSVVELAQQLLPGKMVFSVYTCAKDSGKSDSQIKEIAEGAGCRYLGKFGCRGYNTYGPWKLIGGMNKGHPDEQELAAFCAFYEKLLAVAVGGGEDSTGAKGYS